MLRNPEPQAHFEGDWVGWEGQGYDSVALSTGGPQDCSLGWLWAWWG